MADADLGGQEEAGDGRHQRGQKIGAQVHEVRCGRRCAWPPARGNPTACSRSPLLRAVQPEVAGDRRDDQHEERCGQWSRSRVRRNSVKPGLTGPPGVGRSSSAMPCRTLSMAIVVMTGLTPAIADHRAIDRPDDKPGEQAASDARATSCDGPIFGGDDEGSEHHGQAHHRADRDVEAAHQQHVELRHGDQRQRRGRQQDMAEVERGQEDVRLRCGVSRRPEPSARAGSRAGSTICCCRRQAFRRRDATASAACRCASARRASLRRQEGRDDVLLGDVGARSARG